MKLSILGWEIEISKKEKEMEVIKEETKFTFIPKQIVEFSGEFIPGYQALEEEMTTEGDSVEEREYYEEQTWLNKRKQKDGNI